MKKEILNSIKIFLLALVVVSSVGVASAITAPPPITCPPVCATYNGPIAGWNPSPGGAPANNIAAPINVSKNPQPKAGQLYLGQSDVPATLDPDSTKLDITGSATMSGGLSVFGYSAFFNPVYIGPVSYFSSMAMPPVFVASSDNNSHLASAKSAGGIVSKIFSAVFGEPKVAYAVQNVTTNNQLPMFCLDINASNYGYPLPCNYPPGQFCTDPSASNYPNGLLPCTYANANSNIMQAPNMTALISMPLNPQFNVDVESLFKQRVEVASNLFANTMSTNDLVVAGHNVCLSDGNGGSTNCTSSSSNTTTTTGVTSTGEGTHLAKFTGANNTPATNIEDSYTTETSSGDLTVGGWKDPNHAKFTVGDSTYGGDAVINGKLKITGGSPGAGKILTSNDANGNATWKAPGIPVYSENSACYNPLVGTLTMSPTCFDNNNSITVQNTQVGYLVGM